MKCIVLFGGKGTRVGHISKGVNKALIDIGSMPIAYYVLQNLIQEGLDPVVVTNPEDVPSFKEILDKYFANKNIDIVSQQLPEGVPDGILKGESKIENEYFAVCLGDFYSEEIGKVMIQYNKQPANYLTLNKVSDPSKYGVIDENTGKIVEKPKSYVGSMAVRGFYIFSRNVFDKIPQLKKSYRGEYEITDLINQIEYKTVEINQVIDLGSEKGINEFRLKTR